MAEALFDAGALTQVLAAWLVTYALHGTVLIGVIWLLAGRLPEDWIPVRDVLWKAALVGALVTATTQLGLSVGLGDAGRGGRAPGLELLGIRESAGLSRGAGSPAVRGPSVRGLPVGRPIPIPAGWSGPLVGLWLLAAGGGLALLGLRHARLRRALRTRRPVEDGQLQRVLEDLARAAGLGRPVRLTRSAAITGPIAFGSAEICLPERALTELTDPERTSVLAHEVAHLARCDPRWLLAARLVERLFPFQPLNRLVTRRLRDVAELACDDWASRRSTDRLALARCLLQVAAWTRGAPIPAEVSPMVERRSGLVHRVERLLTEPRRSRGGARWDRPVGLITAALLGAVVLAVVPVASAGERADPGRRDIDLRSREEPAARRDAGRRPGHGPRPARNGGERVGPEMKIRARDPAGAFTLTLVDGRAVGATLDGDSLGLDRLRQVGDSVRFLDENGARLFAVRVKPDGGISWRARGPTP